jgi:hypothetical protein
VVRHTLVPNRRLTENDLTNCQRLLERPSGADADEAPGAEADEFLDHDGCYGRAKAELAHDADSSVSFIECPHAR